MLRFLFDTDHLTLYEQGHAPLLQRVTVQGPGTVGVSAVTVEEVLRGRLGYLARPLSSVSRVRGYALLVETVRLLNQMAIVPFDHRSEAQYQQLRAQKTEVGTQDLKIAALALNNFTLVTRIAVTLAGFRASPSTIGRSEMRKPSTYEAV
jgi:tRNA(fMet)-specific endonuclease VapC